MRKHIRTIARRPNRAADLSLGQLLALLTNLLGVLTPAILSKDGIGQSGG
jgi:hypothetical protein